MRFFQLILTLLFFSSTGVIAQTCCSGGIPLSNNIGMAILGEGTAQLGIHYDYNNLNTLNNGSDVLHDHSRLRVTHSVLVNFSYSFSDKFSVEGLLTWVNQRRKISQLGNQNLDQSKGIGDGVILAKYDLSTLFGPSNDFSIGLGTKIPLGSSNEKNDLGITLNADLQPGSNAWDLIYWTSFSRRFNSRPSLIFNTRFIYRSSGTNSSYFGDTTYKFGNEFLTFLSFSDQFILFKKLVSPGVSLKYRNAIRDKIGGFELENTGGNWISLIPNVSFNMNQNTMITAKAELPIFSAVDGTQLTPTYRITTGILFRIPVKKQVFNLN